MAVIGPDGNDLPERRADGVLSSDWFALNSRTYTTHGREPFQRDYGVGMAQALGSPAVDEPELRRRWTVSLANYPLVVEDSSIIAGNSFYRIELDLRRS